VSAFPSQPPLPADPDADETGPKTRMPVPGFLYGLGIAATAIAIAIPLVLRLDRHTSGWANFALIAAGAAIAQLFVVRHAHRNQSYHAHAVFLIPAILLLPPELLVLVAVIQHIPEWLKERYAWYIQCFNVCVFTIANLTAWLVADRILGADSLISSGDVRFALAGFAACLFYVGLNHAVLAPMLRFARNLSLRELRDSLFSFESLSTDFILATLGLGVAAFWKLNPYLVPFAIAPLLLIHRSLAVPQLQAEARVDPKTGLFNARHYANVLADELARAARFDRPLSLIMADLDLLRDINNTYGHLAGDAVLKGIAEVFRQQLRHYDVPARFGGEEFCILLPETPPDQAMEIAERIRRAVAEREYEVETSSEPIRATISLGVASFPRDGADANELIHQADLAVYRAKLQGRNRVLDATNEPLLAQPAKRTARLVRLPDGEPEHVSPLPAAAEIVPPAERRAHPRPQSIPGPRFFNVQRRLAVLVGLVSVAGLAAGVAGLVFGSSTDIIGIVAVVALVGLGEALALEVEDTGSLSVSAVGALTGAALFGTRAALPLAITIVAVAWSARRHRVHEMLFNAGAVTVASLAAVGGFSLAFDANRDEPYFALAGLLAGVLYFVVNTGLVSLALAVEGRESWWKAWQERYAWVTPHYVVYGFIGGVIALAYSAQGVGLFALAVFSVPLLLMRKTQEAYLKHTQRSAQKLRQAAETIQTQNVSLEQANRLLKERSTAAMESLSATVDARDAYTAGHSRRVQQLALAIGRELGLSQAEQDLLGHAALFHDIGKLAVPDSVLLKPSKLTEEEWALMQRHAEEGAHIINRLGFLNDAVPAIRHHHERFDGAGYPDGLAGEEIPLGARIIHVADALDSMLTTRVYRPARPADEALDELRRMSGTQFCPRCVQALEAIVSVDGVSDPRPAAAAPALLAS
jgi:diguanylate cyclase (GGDEF)-like protein/putative nucleotidyltransferase with HDIG domain